MVASDELAMNGNRAMLKCMIGMHGMDGWDDGWHMGVYYDGMM